MARNLALLAAPTAPLIPFRRPHAVIDPVANFRAVGDGMTDNADAFMQMHKFLRANWDQPFVIDFPHGHYVYTENTWLDSVGSVTIRGNGSKFECTRTSVWFNRRLPLFVRGMVDDSPPGGQPQGPPQARFATAQAGEMTLTLLPQISGQPYLSISEISAGDRIFLYCFDQQFAGYPPNCRYFEWNKVVAVDVSAQQLSLEKPLRFRYDENLRDNTHGGASITFGSARLMKLDRSSGFHYPKFIKLKDLTLVLNRNYPDDHGGVQIPAEHLILNNVNAPEQRLWLGMNNLAEVSNSAFESADIDKLGDVVFLENCTFHNNLGPASGIKKLVVKDCLINGHIKAAAREVFVYNNTILPKDQWGAVRLSPPGSNRVLEVKNNDIVYLGRLNFVVNNDRIRLFKAESVDGNVIKIFDTESNRDIINLLDFGSKLIKGDQVVTIEYITFDDTADEWLIKTDTADIQPNDELACFRGQNFKIKNNRVNVPTFDARQENVLFEKGVLETELPFDTSTNISILAFVERIMVYVIRPHQNIPDGKTPVIRAWIKDNGDDNIGVFIADVSVNSGIEIGSLDEHAFGGVSEIVQSLSPSQFVHRIKIFAHPHRGDMRELGWDGDIQDQPRIRLRIYGSSIF